MALSHPEVSFSCRCDGRTVLRAPGHGTLREALRATLRADKYVQLIDIAVEGEVMVHGAISQPRMHQATRGGLVLIVNRRRVYNRALLAAVEEAYRGLLPGDRHPFGAVVVDLDPNTVDVNVHPTKREVRFREERRVFSAVQRACWAALSDARLVVGVPVLPADPPAATDAPGQPALELAESAPGWRAAFGALPAAAEPARLADLAPLRAIGQAGAGWLLADSPRGLVIIDPHAAHEKLLYVELMDAARAGDAGGAPASQLLLLDAVVDVGVEDVAENVDLRRLGFDIEPFGPGLVRVRAVPAAAAAVDVARLIRDAVAALGEPGDDRLHRLAALTACHAAVRLGDRLDAAEQSRLLGRLPHLPGGMTCPHGRPTVHLLDDTALRRAFRRPT
jgi:DNA mismatch repair protein MutL